MKIKALCFIILSFTLQPTLAKDKVDQTGTAPSQLTVFNKTHGKQFVDASESEIAMTTTRRPSEARLRLNEHITSLLYGDPTSDIDLINDSAEVDESFGVSDIGLEDELKLPKKTEKSSFQSTSIDSNKNVFKVPRPKTKKFRQSSVTGPSLNTDSTINNFMHDYLTSSGINFSSKHDNYFHAFMNMYDHFLWNQSSMSNLSATCFQDVSFYINELKASKTWALKVSDASGRYRGQFFFDNDFWLGSKKLCYEINLEYENAVDVPELKFFVLRMVLYIGEQTAVSFLKIKIISSGYATS